MWAFCLCVVVFFHFLFFSFCFFYCWFLSTVNIRYLECLLFRTFNISNFFFGPFSIFSNFNYNYNQYLEPCHLQLSLCRTNFSVLLALLSRFLELLLENSSKTLRFDRMLIFLCSFIITRTFFLYNRNTMSDNRKLNVKNKFIKCKTLRDLDLTKRLLQSMGMPKNSLYLG